MKIFEYIKKLLPSISKDRISEDLRLTIAVLENQCIPTYQEASNYFKTEKLKSKEVINLINDFNRALESNGVSKQINMISEISLRLGFIRDNAIYVQEQLENVFEKDILSEGLTIKQTHFIRAAEVFYFISKYSLDVLKYIYHKEAELLNPNINENIELSKMNIKLVEKNLTIFTTLISNYGIPNEKFRKIITEIPDVIINSKTYNSVAGIYSKEKETDPFTRGMISNFNYNPIYHLRMIVAEWQNDNYKANQEKKKELELRLLYLQSVKEKQISPSLEKEISITQQRVDKLDFKIHEYEEDLGLA